MKTFRLAILTAVIALAGLIAAPYAPATPIPDPYFQLQLASGSNTVTIQDGSSSDSNPLVGVITYIGSVDTWNINVTTGLTYPQVGSTTAPAIDLNSVNALGSGTLTISASALNFTAVPLSVSLLAGGTTGNGGTVSVADFYNASNAFFGGTQFLSVGPFGAGAFASSANGFVDNPGAMYSLTEQVVISHTLAGQVTSLNATTTAVPEPTGLLLLGSGLVGLVGFGKKFKK